MTDLDRRVVQWLRTPVYAAIAIVAVIAIILGVQHRYLSNFFGGPRAITFDELAAIGDVNAVDRYYVRVDGGKLHDIGVVEKTVAHDRVTASYGGYDAGNRRLVVRRDQPIADGDASPLTGTLEPLTGEEVEHIHQYANEPARFDFKLDTASFDGRAYATFAICAALLLVALPLLIRFRNGADANRSSRGGLQLDLRD